MIVLPYTRLVVRALLDWVAPRDCAGCDERLEIDEVLFCGGCAATLDPVATPLLHPPAPRAACFAFGGPVATAVRRMKFTPRPDLAPLLGGLLTEACGPAYRGRVDLVVPVPLHRTRLVERGFDQAVLIARPLARALARPLVARALSRIRATAPQSSLDARARAENVAGAFVPTPSGRRALPGRRVLLVDDVRTTGATLDECARVARDAGAIEVLALALAAA